MILSVIPSTQVADNNYYTSLGTKQVSVKHIEGDKTTHKYRFDKKCPYNMTFYFPFIETSNKTFIFVFHDFTETVFRRMIKEVCFKCRNEIAFRTISHEQIEHIFRNKIA